MCIALRIHKSQSVFNLTLCTKKGQKHPPEEKALARAKAKITLSCRSHPLRQEAGFLINDTWDLMEMAAVSHACLLLIL
jgi:hypothetical protein